MCRKEEGMLTRQALEWRAEFGDQAQDLEADGGRLRADLGGRALTALRAAGGNGEVW